jgi:hypothetical protein
VDQIVLLKIESLHARVVQEAGLKLRRGGHEFYTGTIAAILDATADPLANLGLLNLSTGLIHLRWAIIATLPIMADASAAGEVLQKESAPLRVSFDEIGEVAKNGYSFDAMGGGEIAPGSLLSSATISSQNNRMRTIPVGGKKISLNRALAKGDSVRCALIPESYLDIVLPKPLGGGKHRLNLVGGFVLAPLLTFAGRKKRK